MYEIQLFGRLEVRTRGVRLTGDDLGGARARHILALLALYGSLRTSELSDLLWPGNPPVTHEAIVESEVALLRHHLDSATSGDSVIAESNDGYALVAERVRVDVARFDELLAAAAGRTATRALPPLTAAAELAGRPLLEDVAAPRWAVEARARYRSRLVTALLTAAGAALTTGDARNAVQWAGRALVLDPGATLAHTIRATAQQALVRTPVARLTA
ncbi:AfsR/SARP family transcriptional regulator [Symbioplanes lichenis]|uniref:AfsR/SARP family transcriptional regulator n=1 Tax=Symbioplanes lichenis TaxID=1629072 RepID=UPI00273942EB|nr:hypothetical protein [Actinoplanes lichenis]